MGLAGDLIREARRRAALTQAELAGRVGTTQSVIARWESGRADPSIDTVRRVMRAAGFDLLVALDEYDDSDLVQAMQLLQLTPAERIDQVARTAAFVQDLRRAREAIHG